MSKIQFLPTDYKPPKVVGGYMKIQDGENKIRILSAPLLGWLDWKDNKPLRFPYDAKPEAAIDPKKPVKHFWAFIVWNYIEEKIQILEITQATLRNALQAYCEDADWGAPYFYDIKITKKGAAKDTEYSVTALPHKALGDHIQAAFNELPISLDALLLGADPFDSAYAKNRTPGVFNMGDMESGPETISQAQADELQAMLDKCDITYQESFWKSLKNNNPPVHKFSALPIALYQRIYTAIKKNKREVA